MVEVTRQLTSRSGEFGSGPDSNHVGSFAAVVFPAGGGRGCRSEARVVLSVALWLRCWAVGQGAEGGCFGPSPPAGGMASTVTTHAGQAVASA